MADGTPSVDGSGSGGVTGANTGSTPVTINEGKKSSLRASGFSDAQIEALMALADPDDQGNSLTPTHFYAVDKSTLNALKYAGELNDAAKQLVYVQTPVSMLNQVSNPANWQGDNYIGPGAQTINAYTLGEKVDFSKPSLDALVMSVLTARADIIQVQLREQIESIQEKNKRLEEANSWLVKAKNEKQKAADKGTTGTTTFTNEFKSVWNRFGANSFEGSEHNSSQWEVNIEGLKTQIEALTSQSQLETTKLQQTINKYNQSFEMLSNFINKYYQSLSTVIQNLR
ncbi:hypothetical protein GZ77_12795 [Endozoicomonas montiporae]|uniref:Uncharacterized protein n=2 Tax=Endozoicomonas montiporae TaxID=1027273 RepID=A0A081N4D0_9GAMM|nr:hypothetical protein [Endozoicomonas montiporae]AMO57852.1 type III secretion cytoplasmic LcrG inhibitor [Endozoicomonas montiporae CL-33]KEQ13303.1 hypothetical protein GZ77_12795 [Endozoicomonas montiporae]